MVSNVSFQKALCAVMMLIVGSTFGWIMNWLSRWDYTVEERITVKNTTWNAEIRSNRCMLSCNSYQGVDIRLVNYTSGDRVELIEGADVLNDDLASGLPGELKITLANLSVATLHEVSVPGVHIIWNFIPKDDPNERNSHKAWVFGDKSLEVNREWYCHHMLPDIPYKDLQELDRTLARTIYGADSKNKSYCLVQK